MLKNYIKTAWRNTKRHLTFSLINAGGLTLGMSSCIILMLYVSYHLNFDKQFKNHDNIYIVETNIQVSGKTFTNEWNPAKMAFLIKNEIPNVEHAVRIDNHSAGGLIAYKEKILKRNGLFCDQDFFETFNYNFISGNAQSALVQPNAIVITETLAKNLFGGEDPMNKVIKRNGKTDLVVTGVIEDVPQNSTAQFDYVLPWSLNESENSYVRDNGQSKIIVQLKSQSDFKLADKLISNMISRLRANDHAASFLFPYSKLHLYAKFENGKSVGGLIEQIRLFIILAICILAVACFNFMNLSTARSQERAKEVGIRKVLGSTRKMLIWQFIIESIMLSLISMLASIIIVWLAIPSFNNLLKINLTAPYQRWDVWMILLGLCVFTGLLSGSYPAFYLSSFQPIKVLKGIFNGGGNAIPIRKILVVIQFIFATFLITATICIYKQIKFIQNKSIGYDRYNLVEIPIEGKLASQSDILIANLKRTNSISNASILSQSLSAKDRFLTWGISWPNKQPNDKVMFDVFNFGYDIQSTLGIKLTDGREFSGQFIADTAGNTVMINETAAKVMELSHPVGTIIKYGDQPVTIVGVFKDFVWGSPYKKIAPMIAQCSIAKGVVLLRLNNQLSISNGIEQIQKNLKAINPAYPPMVKFVDSDFEQKFEDEKTLSAITDIFGFLTIIISCLGLLALAMYAAEQRIKEIGIRKILGANINSIVGLLSKDFLKLVFIAIVISIPMSIWILNKWLQKFEFRISLNWWMFVLAGFITIIIALITVAYQALKAAIANPVKSLRSE